MAAQHLSEKFHDKQLQKIKDQWKKGDRQNAVNQCQEILRSAPQYAPAHLIYAGFLSDSGNAQEAAKHYEAACSLPETAPECFLGFAVFCIGCEYGNHSIFTFYVTDIYISIH